MAEIPTRKADEPRRRGSLKSDSNILASEARTLVTSGPRYSQLLLQERDMRRGQFPSSHCWSDFTCCVQLHVSQDLQAMHLTSVCRQARRADVQNAESETYERSARGVFGQAIEGSLGCARADSKLARDALPGSA